MTPGNADDREGKLRGERKAHWLRLLAIVAVLAMTATACGGDDDEEPQDGGNGTEPQAQFVLAQEGRLTVGSDIPYPPFEFEDESGNLTGFDVEIVDEIAERTGLQHDPNSDWISTDFGTIFQELQRGTNFDIIVAAVTAYAPEGSPAAKTVAEREKFVAFSTPYYPALQALVINTEETPDIGAVDDLPDGARVGVQDATTGSSYAEANLVPAGAELVFFEKSPQMYLQLQAGQLDAVFNDLPTSEGEIKNKPKLEIVEQVDTGEEYGIGVAKDNQELLQAINTALEEMFADGTYADIFEKYFPEQDMPEYAQ